MIKRNRCTGITDVEKNDMLIARIKFVRDAKEKA